MRNFFFLLIFSSLLLQSCVNDGEVLFDIDIEADFDVAPGLNTFETFYFPINRVPTNIGAFIGSTDRTTIAKILPSRADIRAVFGEFDWSIIQEVTIWATSVRDPERRAEIFYQDQISLNGQNELRLFSSNSEVSDILLNDAVHLEVAFRFRRVTPAQIRSRLRMKFIAFGTE